MGKMGALVGKKKPAGVLQNAKPTEAATPTPAATPEGTTPNPAAEAKPAGVKMKKKPGFARGAVKHAVKRAFLR